MALVLLAKNPGHPVQKIVKFGIDFYIGETS